MPLDEFVEYFNCKKIDGSVSMSKRQEIVDSFQNDKNVKLLVGQINAMGVGLTLTSASNMAIIEFGWTPADHDQVADRLHRIGQKKSVSIFYLVAFGTIEEWIIKILQEQNGTIFQAELMEKLSTGKVGITRLLDKLEAKQLIERKRRGMNNIVILKD